MLSLIEDGNGTRREFLRIGTAAIGGLTLPGLLAARARASAGRERAIRDKAVVVLNLQGGPTQFETFDPNMSAPSEIRSITGELKTSLAGVTFGGTLPRLARLAHKMAIVRSYRHGISSHGPAALHVMAGGNPTGASMNVLYPRVAGLTDAKTGMPTSTLVLPAAVGDEYKGLYGNAGRVANTGKLSAVYKPFDPSAGGEIVDNLRLRIDPRRLDDRRSLLGEIDRLRRRVDGSLGLGSADRFQQQAFDVLSKGLASAFDLRGESPATVARYDTSSFEPTADVRKRSRYAAKFAPVALGRQMLLARRLCEAGCRFVTVASGGWDWHGGGKEFPMKDGVASLTPAVDKAVSAFIEDVDQRGLSEKILLVITGEFGRTPRINKNGGRDHWGDLCTLAFVGGGLRMGQVIGRSDKNGTAPASEPISSGNVLATVMHTLFEIGEARVLPDLPKEHEQVIPGGEPIDALF